MFVMRNVHHRILGMFNTHIGIITVFHTHVADRTTGMIVMYADHRILSGLKIQVSWDVKLSLGDQFLVTSLMGFKQPEQTSRTDLAWLGMQHSDEI